MQQEALLLKLMMKIDVTPKDVVRIKGEVDKEMFSTEIDVDTIELKK